MFNRVSEGVLRIDMGDAIEVFAREAVGIQSMHRLLSHVGEGRCIAPAGIRPSSSLLDRSSSSNGSATSSSSSSTGRLPVRPD